MNRLLLAVWPVWCIRSILAGLFIYAGCLKIQSPQIFSDSIHSFKLIPKEVIMPIAITLPLFEIVLGLLLLSKRTTRTASLGITLLMGLFTVAVLSALARGLKIDCGCFGSGAPSFFRMWVDVARDIILMIMALFSYLSTNHLPYAKRYVSIREMTNT